MPEKEPTPKIFTPEVTETVPTSRIGDVILGKVNGRVVQMEVVPKDDKDPEGDDTVALLFTDVDGTKKRGSYPVEVLSPEVQEAMHSQLEIDYDMGHQALNAGEVSAVDESYQVLSREQRRAMREEAEAKFGPAPSHGDYVPQPLVPTTPTIHEPTPPKPFDLNDPIDGAHRKITTIIAQPPK